MKKSKKNPEPGIYLGLLLFCFACAQLWSLESTNDRTKKATNSNRTPPAPIEKKLVNDKGGYFYTDGKYAFGPFTEKMRSQCLEWGGGQACNMKKWTEKMYLNTYGDSRCPAGSRLNRIIDYCIEGQEALGPFPEDLMAACQREDGGNSCKTNRWNYRFLYRLLREEGAIASPKGVPPQFVLLAFDGSQSLDAWQKSRQFSECMEEKGVDVRFTYFISGVYFVTRSDRALYKPPGNRRAGSSDIGWAKSAEKIGLRLEQVNLAYGEGHEIASHAVGHFDGSKWSESDWNREFDYFDKFIFSAHEINDLPGFLAFERSAIQGFRAPLLGNSKGLYETLRKRGFRYDTSKTARSNYWPEKQNEVWNFPLASLTSAFSGKSVLSMDYNFYYLHSRAKPNSANAKRYEEDTLQTYIKYFESNYYGNRAPIHIGHHFSAWNKGAYWKAMLRFAEKVCGLPQVQCVTYSELADFMDLLSPEAIALYQQGKFPEVPEEELTSSTISNSQEWETEKVVFSLSQQKIPKEKEEGAAVKLAGEEKNSDTKQCSSDVKRL